MLIFNFVIVTVSSTMIMYGLWYVHNDHPFYAALLAGIFFAIYDTLNISYRRENVLRIEMLEKRVEELENAEDALYD